MIDANKQYFWLKLLIFALPFAIPFLALTFTLMYLGESMPIRLVLWHQEGEETVLYHPRFGNRFMQYKVAAVNLWEPEIITLGSSRVLQIREGFFNNNPDAFYNVGAPAWTVDEVYEFITRIDQDALPEIIILGIDPPWFNDNYEEETFSPPDSELDNILQANVGLIKAIVRGESFDRPNFEIADYFERQIPERDNLALGLKAIRDGHGFRNDGSELYGDFLVAGWLWQPQQRENHLRMMREGEDIYAYGSELSESKLAILRDFLDFTREHNILVIGFLPSYTPTLWQEMLQSPNHTYVPKVTVAMEEIFAEYNYPFFDYSNGAWYGASEEDFFDGWHASERANLQMYIDMVRQVPELQVYSDVSVLEQYVANAPSTWYVFGD